MYYDPREDPNSEEIEQIIGEMNETLKELIYESSDFKKLYLKIQSKVNKNFAYIIRFEVSPEMSYEKLIKPSCKIFPPNSKVKTWLEKITPKDFSK